MAEPRFIVFDNETTGLTVHQASDVSRQPRIIEFAAILTDGREVLETFEQLINPMMVLEDIITKITGLTNEDLDGQPLFRDVYPKIGEFFAKGDYYIAHNMSFDRALLKYDLQRCGKTLADINFTGRPICTVEETMPAFGRRMKLSELYEMYCGPYEQKHRALDDIMLLHEVCKKIGLYESLGAK